MKNSIKNMKLPLKTQTGSVMLEALIAILIFSFGLLAIAGLQAAMIKNTVDSNYRAEAGYIVQQQIGRMWANPTGLATFEGTTAIPRLPNGSLVVTRTIGNRFNFVVTWQTPGEDAHNFTSNASIDF